MPARNPPAYDVRNLRKVYENPRVVANDGITFAVEPGEAFGLLGPNGAGKTTLVRQLVGLISPSGGAIRLFGESVRPGETWRKRCGRTVAYLPQGSLTFGELTVAEAIRWTGMLRGLGRTTATTETEELLDVLQLAAVAGRGVRKLSGGQKRLTQLGMTFVGRLPVVILDEPTADIDPALRRRVWEMVSERVGAGSAVILVTHDVAEAEHALDRVAILDRGKVAATGTPSELKADLSHRTRIELVVAEGGGIEARSVASEIGSDTRVHGRHVSAWVPADLALRTLEKVLATLGTDAFEDIRLVTPTLEDVYLELGGHLFEEAEHDGG